MQWYSKSVVFFLFQLMLPFLVYRRSTLNVFGGGNDERRTTDEAWMMSTTTACAQKRSRSDYNARVDWTYLYVLEYENGDDPVNDDDDDIPIIWLRASIERAVATSIITTLGTTCTSNGQYPLYAVDWNVPSPSSYSYGDHDLWLCPLSNDTTTTDPCHTTLSTTSILFRDSDHPNNDTTWTSQLETLIAATINDVNYLNQFVAAEPMLSDRRIQLTRTQYERAVGQTIVRNVHDADDDDADMNNTIKVAIITAVVSFSLTILMLTLILCYCRGVISNRSSAPNHRRKRPHLLYSFEPLDDDVCFSDSNHDPTIRPTGWMIVTDDDPQPEATHLSPTTTGRSVVMAYSDLTSDSESIMSSLHLDRIDEVDEELGDYSYEHQDHQVNDTDVSHMQNLSHLDETIEVSLKNRAVSNLPTIYPDCTSLNFIEDWKVSHQPIDVATTGDSSHWNEQYHSEEAIANLSIEISIDDEIIVSANDTDENDFDPFSAQNDMVNDSFTFVPDNVSDCSPQEHVETYMKDRNGSQDLPSGHIYDADDFQSIEISVVWMDGEVLDNENDNDREIVLEKSTSSAIFEISMSEQPTTKVEGDEPDTSTEHSSHTMEEPAAVAVSEQPTISALTDSDKFVLQDSTESTLFTNDGFDSFSSSNAYRSVLDYRVSDPTTVNDSPTVGSNNDENDGIEMDSDPAHYANHTPIAHWARDVLMKLMSDSPKMLQCDQSHHEQDFDSDQSNDT